MSETRGKRKRGKDRQDVSMLVRHGQDKTAVDLMVLTSRSKKQNSPSIRLLLHRWTESGFTHVALVHTVYGRATEADRASTAIPELEYADFVTAYQIKHNHAKPLHVLRRLHAVVENVSDIGFYTANNPEASFLHEYDLISLAPRNDATFESICASATGMDILTLDYTSGRGGVQLPFRMRSANIQAAVRRGITLEVAYAPAVLVRSTRKGWIQTSRELQVMQHKQPPTMIVSSGSRLVDECDVGALALRMPGDLVNVLQTVLGWDQMAACKALAEHGLETIQRARQRRFGGSDRVLDVRVEMDIPAVAEPLEQESDEEDSKLSRTKNTKAAKKILARASSKVSRKPAKAVDEDILGEDGFVSFT